MKISYRSCITDDDLHGIVRQSFYFGPSPKTSIKLSWKHYINKSKKHPSFEQHVIYALLTGSDVGELVKPKREVVYFTQKMINSDQITHWPWGRVIFRIVSIEILLSRILREVPSFQVNRTFLRRYDDLFEPFPLVSKNKLIIEKLVMDMNQLANLMLPPSYARPPIGKI